MDGQRYPLEDQTITAITVKGGEVRVSTASALIVKPHRVVIRVSDQDSDLVPKKGQTVTLLYDLGGERVLRLKNVVTDVLQGTKWLLQPTAQVAEGERREFLRATASVRIYADTVNEYFELPAEPSDGSSWASQKVDISGSGVGFKWNGRCKKGDHFYVELAFPDGSVRALGTVVRAKPTKNKESLNVAVHFDEVPEGDRDLLISYVFRHYYEKMNFKPID